MLHKDHLGVLAAQSEGEFRAEIARFANNLGFRTADALTVLDHEASETQFVYVSTIENPSWYALDPGYGRRDPVMQHCKRSSVPMVWGARTYVETGLVDIHDVLSAFGMQSGIHTCCHLRNGRHFVMSMHTDKDVLADSRHVSHALPQLQLFMTHALDAAFRLFLPAETLSVELTRMEVDVLSWLLDGKSKEEIAVLLNVSSDALTICLRRLEQSLSCANEHQAALKALRLGIIH
ncbi:autoinducer binding domain-containing protein [Pelomonas sp. APW6]|uniref:Autoinducer binding domain-containing protein n=1 Tax=Roseateles subflavus TaxID=3053353 RepID=A0ABT7LFE0_9BURK|nr:autoinducer binding domain-containing protein [Pelomonas sp. APW6]MDL5031017.1 autoinducer binding domain-containing protein [Pelomonas sp. APW6]